MVGACPWLAVCHLTCPTLLLATHSQGGKPGGQRKRERNWGSDGREKRKGRGEGGDGREKRKGRGEVRWKIGGEEKKGGEGVKRGEGRKEGERQEEE